MKTTIETLTFPCEVIDKIKTITKTYMHWFYSKESLDIENRTDRMENEELITILSFLIHHVNE